MKIIYSGGWDKTSPESIKASFMYTYREIIAKAVQNGKKIAMVTLAKKDGSYDSLIQPLYSGLVDVIDTKSTHVDWGRYDGIFIPGGSGALLKDGLMKAGFSMEVLKKDAVVLGDSAGAYILSTYFYQTPPGEKRGVDLEILEGFNPGANMITIAHKNNPVYCNALLMKKIKAFAKELGLKLLILNENEQRLLQRGRFVKVDPSTLF